jgi:hypothetical protein
MTNQTGAQPQRESAVTPAQQDVLRKWMAFLDKVQTDKELKQRLIENPVAVFKEHQLPVPEGVEFRVVQNTDKVVYLALPAEAPTAELTPDQLEDVVGGTMIESGLAYYLMELLTRPLPAVLTGRHA